MPSQVVTLCQQGKWMTAQVMTSVIVHIRSPLSNEQFLKKAKDFPAKIWTELVRDAEPHEFETGSFGWRAYKSNVHVKVGGADVTCTVNFNAPLKGTRTQPSADSDDASVDPDDASVDSDDASDDSDGSLPVPSYLQRKRKALRKGKALTDTLKT